MNILKCINGERQKEIENNIKSNGEIILKICWVARRLKEKKRQWRIKAQKWKKKN